MRWLGSGGIQRKRIDPSFILIFTQTAEGHGVAQELAEYLIVLLFSVIISSQIIAPVVGKKQTVCRKWQKIVAGIVSTTL